VVLILARLLQEVVPLGLDNDVTGRAGERAFACALDIDVMASRHLEDRCTERCVDLAPGPVALDKDHLGHQPGPGGSSSGRGAKSSARIAAPSAGDRPAV